MNAYEQRIQRSFRNPWLFAGLLGVLVCGTQLLAVAISLWRGDPGYHWTHQDRRLPLESASGQCEIYVGGRQLPARLNDGTLWAADPQGVQFRVVEKDVSVRLNHWPQVRAGLLFQAAISAFVLGISLALLGVGLGQVFGRKAPPPAAGSTSGRAAARVRVAGLVRSQ